MTDFPSLTPQTRTYTPGSFAVRRSKVMSGDEAAVRKNNAVVGHSLSLTFVSSTITVQNSIFSHYAIQNRFLPFDLPSTITDGGGFSFPANYQWIYAAPPEVTFAPSNIQVTVQLELVPPYDI